MTAPAKSHRWRPIGSPESRGYGTLHRRIRRAMLRDEPNCRECAKEGRTTKASHADHIKPKCLGGGDERTNYQPLCVAHARSKTGREGAMIRNARRRARAKMKADA
ncbi:5-methylcytosine-specific restriction protein A [Sphingopyxis italica]|uniref:5-methylcytosine-specific restriction protein A n=1 Tax=Sphingopyxis italica TaxID=1129133 RepID=A0A7X5XVF3_9SPHN|nr:HNH endonuclease signature motif containing protein [Sphingopyxis italica]NJB90562.1 5-methylcytosine-specific restriction protein A [Sphingopyxis italica]